MRLISKAWGLCALSATLQIVSPLAADAGEPAAAQPGVATQPGVTVRPATSPLTIRDVELDASGALRGQMLTPEGAAMANSRVTLAKLNEVVAEATTDKEGKFALTGLRGGIYELRSPGSSATVRLWTHDSAPPAASKAALFVTERSTVRGNINYHSTQMMLAPEAIGAVMIPAAVGGGIIVLKQHHESDSGS